MTILVETNQPSLVKMVLAFCQALGVLSFKAADDTAKYNARIVADAALAQKGDHTNALVFDDVDAMYQHFNVQPDTAK